MSLMALFLLLLLPSLAPTTAMAVERTPQVVDLWQGGAATLQGVNEKEITNPPDPQPGQRIHQVRNVHNPSIELFLPEPGKANGAAMIVAPGGGHRELNVGMLNQYPTGTGQSFKGPVGLQLYSLREQFAKDVTATLDQVRGFGIKYVELAGTYKIPPEKFKALLDARGLKPISGHFSYEQYRDQIEEVAREAKTLGLQYVGCAWIPHQAPFNEKTAREAIAVFNRAGEALAKHGLKFFYHIHGYEFQPYANGTLFDLMMTETKPQFVRYQMDVFWVVHPGQDPVKLLEKYGGRFELMHVKDMRKGTPTGLLTGVSDVKNDVALGTGVMDWPAILKAANKAGVKWYFIEDESPASVQQIPQSLRYLEKVKF